MMDAVPLVAAELTEKLTALRVWSLVVFAVGEGEGAGDGGAFCA